MFNIKGGLCLNFGGGSISVNGLSLFFSTNSITFNILLYLHRNNEWLQSILILTAQTYEDNTQLEHKMYTACQNRTAAPQHNNCVQYNIKTRNDRKKTTRKTAPKEQKNTP
jgi:hypothetical protein